MSVYSYAIINQIAPENEYPYLEKNGTCKYTGIVKGITLKGCKRIMKNNATAIKEELMNGPVTIGIDDKAIPIKFAPEGK